MKNLLFLSDPLFWITIMLGFYFFAKKKKWKILGIAFFILLTNNWLAYFALHLWEYQTISVNDIQEPYAIAIILGPFMNPKKSILDKELKIYMVNERLRQSLELYEKGKFKKFLLTGKGEVNPALTFLINHGVPAEAILFECQATNTYENARFSKQILISEEYYSDRILLITSASHMRRARKCFQTVGLSVTPFSVDYATFCAKLWGVSLGDIIPSQNALKKWGLLIREWLSMIYFGLKGYV